MISTSVRKALSNIITLGPHSHACVTARPTGMVRDNNKVQSVPQRWCVSQSLRSQIQPIHSHMHMNTVPSESVPATPTTYACVLLTCPKLESSNDASTAEGGAFMSENFAALRKCRLGNFDGWIACVVVGVIFIHTDLSASYTGRRRGSARWCHEKILNVLCSPTS